MNKCNIVFGSSTFMTMSKSKILKNVIEFDTIFLTSDISNIDNYEIILPSDIYKENIYSFKKELKRLNKLIDKKYDIRIWTSHYDINSYLLMSYLCNYLKDKDCNIYVVYSELYNDCYSPACMNINELEELSKLEYKLSEEDIIKYIELWNKVIHNKSDMRILENNEVKLVSYDYYNDEILNLLNELGDVKISKLVCMFMKDHYLQDLVISYLIERLIKDNKIKIIKYEERFFENIITLNR